MRKLSRFAPLLVAMLLIASCGKGAEPAQPASGASESGTAESGGVALPEDAGGEPDAKPEPVTVIYYVTDGMSYKLIEKRKTVEPAEPGDLYRLAVEALRDSNEEAGEYALWKHVIFRSVELEGRVLTVDITLPDEARLGSMGESMFIEAIARTAFQFDEVDALEILVDGEQVESLMGHDELPHPIKRGAYPDDLEFRTNQ